ncbi:MAG: hypothetical protein NC427_04185 [Ruminococcus flavefaciens]|nr:hypothetical protein [Ruminococcus flavefaciens]
MKIDDYLEDGRIKRSSISLHIKSRKISRSELEALINNPRIKKGFVGDKFCNKKPQTEWNEEYLDSLVCEAVAGSFNADYLWYLFEVTEYVSAKRNDNLKSAEKDRGMKGLVEKAKIKIKRCCDKLFSDLLLYFSLC